MTLNGLKHFLSKNIVAFKINVKYFYKKRTGGRVVEGTGLENRHTSLSYRGFESLSVRQEDNFLHIGCSNL